jgi:hypothetical protein
MGDTGTIFTLLTMRGLVFKDYLQPIIRLTAMDIVHGIGGKDGVEQAQAIREWLESNTEFLRDPAGVEMLEGPAWTAKRILTHGRAYLDCDAVAVLGAALGKSVGLRARFKAIAFETPKSPFRHVFAELASPVGPPQWVDMDVQRMQQNLPPNVTRVLPIEV